MIQTDNTDKPWHIGYLDGVRGFAAIWLVLYHFINQRYHEHSAAKMVSFFFNGETAIFLFVLSGFALSYKHIVHDRPLDVRKFYVHRIIRFWPAFFIAVLANALYQYRHDLSADNLIDQFLFNKSHFWEEASLIRYNPTARMNPQYYMPGWALVLILSLSFLVPFMVALALKTPKYLWWLIIAFLLIGNNFGPRYLYHIHFALGVLLSCYFAVATDSGLRRYKWYRYRYALLGLAFVLFSLRMLGRVNRVQFFGTDYYYWVRDFLGIDFSHYSGIASFVFMLWIMDSAAAQRLFSMGWLRFAGKIAYSLYLMHWLVVVAIFDNWASITAYFPDAVTAMVCIGVLYIAISSVLAVGLYYIVELPSVRLSRHLTAGWDRSLVIQKAPDAIIYGEKNT